MCNCSTPNANVRAFMYSNWHQNRCNLTKQEVDKKRSRNLQPPPFQQIKFLKELYFYIFSSYSCRIAFTICCVHHYSVEKQIQRALIVSQRILVTTQDNFDMVQNALEEKETSQIPGKELSLCHKLKLSNPYIYGN